MNSLTANVASLRRKTSRHITQFALLVTSISLSGCSTSAWIPMKEYKQPLQRDIESLLLRSDSVAYFDENRAWYDDAKGTIRGKGLTGKDTTYSSQDVRFIQYSTTSPTGYFIGGAAALIGVTLLTTLIIVGNSEIGFHHF